MNRAKFDGVRPSYPVHHAVKVPFEPRIRPPGEFSARALQIRRLDAELDRFILRASDFLELVIDAFAANIQASVEMEGNPLPLEEVRRLTRNSFEGLSTVAPDAHRQEIVNHINLWVNHSWFRPPWNAQKVQWAHDYLMRGVEEDEIVGQFRSEGKTHITENEGRDIVFVAADGTSVDGELKSLLAWLNRDAEALEPIAAATVFFHEFESIHPFHEGNGRTGRVLFHQYLRNHGLSNVHLCHVESVLTQDRELYYRLLSWTDESGSYTELLDFVSAAILEAYQAARDSLAARDLLSKGIDEHAKRLLKRARDRKDWFSVADAADWVDDIQEATVRNHLNDLVEIGGLATEGRTRAKRYRFNDPLRPIRERLDSQDPPWAPAGRLPVHG